MKNIRKRLEFFCIRLARKKIIPMSDKKFLDICFHYYMEKKINWKSPKTYNEKLQWLKIHDRKEIYTKLVDKYEMKEYISKSIGNEYVIPTIGIYDKFDDIDFEKLPEKFVLKCTHDSGGLVICKDKNNFDIKKAKKKINKCLKVNYYYGWREWPYKNVKPRIIIEPYIEDIKYHELRDYKFFCFNGNVKLMFVASNRQGIGDTYFDFFDSNYEHLNIINGHPNAPTIPDKPLNFKEMVRIAERLSKDFLHIRVDFYEVNGKIYVGELTFYHWSGMVPFVPNEWDEKIGNLLNLEGEKNES